MRSRGFLRGCDLLRSSGCRETDSCGELRGREEGEERRARARAAHEKGGGKGAQDREKETRSSARRGVKMAG